MIRCLRNDVIMNKTVHSTSVYFKGFAGSELATLEQAKTFQKMGWSVFVFSLAMGEPLLTLAEGITVADPESLHEIPTHYDLIVARQYPLLDYLLFSVNVTADKVYYEAVGCKYP